VSHIALAAPPALRTLVSGIVDYAGLFPPASLNMSVAVANYAQYRASSDAWMLGRFVLPVSQLEEWRAAVGSLDADGVTAWRGARLSALLSGEFAREADVISAFNATRPHDVQIDVAEGRAASPDAVLAMAAALPDDVLLYCELPHREDPTALLEAVRSAHVRAKIRTGGVTVEAFPTAFEIVRFLRRCTDLGVTAKATAGLHHPLRGEYRLTYSPGEPHGMMYGYLNVFLCAAALRDGASDEVAMAILMIESPRQLTVTDGALRITFGDEVDGRDLIELPESTLAKVRQSGVVAFGSCSFREPVQELGVLLMDCN
jgi:hypothetical protein